MKKKIYLMLVNLLILIFLIKITDMFVVASIFKETQYISDNSKLKVRVYKKDLSVTYNDPIENKKIKLITDDEGFISTKDNLKNLISDNDIFFIGGSTTANIGVASKYRFPNVFRNQIDSLPYEVYNSGVGGNHSFHSNLILLSKILKRTPRPKFIFFHHNVNDLSQLIRTQSYWIDYNERGILESNDNKRFDSLWLNTLFELKELLFPNIYNFLASKIFGRSKLKIKNQIDVEIDQIDREKIFYEFKKSIELFVNICKTYDIQPILISQYSRYKIKDNEIAQIHSDNISRFKLICELHPTFNKIIEQVSDEMGIHFINLSDKIPNTKEFIYDEVHLNEKGNILAGKLISEYFINFIHKK